MVIDAGFVRRDRAREVNHWDSTAGRGAAERQREGVVTADDDRARPVEGVLERAIAVQVRRHRRARGMTVGELALRAGISKAMLSKIENA